MEKILLFTLPIVLLFGTVNFFRPIPSLKPEVSLAASPVSQPVNISWPKHGQAAIGAAGYGVLDAKPTYEARPIASVAKVMTALAVLKQKPLMVGETGPKLTFTKHDVALYQKYLAKNGSVVPVNAGGKLTEFQALQAMLIPSANNIADSLAIWAYGSLDKYLAAANQLATQLGMKASNFADASGFSPKTVSTARDLVMLGQAAVANTVIVNIVNQKSVKLPVAGRVLNTNLLLGDHGLTGIKTGHTDEAGGCFLFSSVQKINGQSVTVIGAVVGARDSAEAINDSVPLIGSARKGFESVQIAEPNQAIAHYKTAWGDSPSISTAKPVSILNWRGRTIQTKFELPESKAPLKSGAKVGRLIIKSGDYESSTDLVIKQDANGPSWTWRLFR